MVESLILDVCSLCNAIISLMGEKLLRLMTGKKKYSAEQFMLMLPEQFTFQFLLKLFEVWGSSHNQLSGKCVAHKFAYLEPHMRVGQGFTESDKAKAL